MCACARGGAEDDVAAVAATAAVVAAAAATAAAPVDIHANVNTKIRTESITRQCRMLSCSVVCLSQHATSIIPHCCYSAALVLQLTMTRPYTNTAPPLQNVFWRKNRGC